MDDADRTFADAVVRWYDAAARDLPWRRPGTPAWAVLVSEVMLQQTPVGRVLPVWTEWIERWPAPAALAAAAPGDAVRAWGRLGYPRRALRLHAAAAAIVERHGGEVPVSYDDLRALPGIGDYTAAAVAAFAYGARVAVLDTNVRRVYRRVADGSDEMPASPTVAERAAALARVPPADPARFSVGVMELGALVCTARAPACEACPVAPICVLRASEAPVPRPELEAVWEDAVQRERALDGLVADGLVEPVGAELFGLPGARQDLQLK